MAKSWGTPTWYLFHSFAEHIDDEFYKLNANHVCNLLQQVCSNLPCEDCRQHAITFTRRTLNSRYIPTKEHLKQYFFDFHNSVNVRLNKPIFKNYDMYKLSKLKPIFENFMNEFAKNSNPLRGFQDQMVRKNILKRFIQFFKQNKDYFKWL